MARSVKLKAKKVVCAAFPYDMSATVDENVQTMSLQMDAFIEEVGRPQLRFRLFALKSSWVLRRSPSRCRACAASWPSTWPRR